MKNTIIYIRKVIRTIAGILITILFIYFSSMFTTQFINYLQMKRYSFDPNKFRYQYELDESPIYSPDHKYKLNMRVACNVSFGGSAMLYGSLTSENNEEQIVYSERCHIIRQEFSDKIKFIHGERPSFEWKNNEILIINGIEISVSDINNEP